MSNFNAVFKAEVARLARKEVRAATEALRKAATQHRSDIAALKRSVADLERKVKYLESHEKPRLGKAPRESAGAKARFSPGWVAADRKRLGFSAKHYGQLVGVTGLTIYNWEKGKSKPRDRQLAAWASIRGLGKREALRRLEMLDS
jgi:DNA-binding transcriptional regulator YiaG